MGMVVVATPKGAVVKLLDVTVNNGLQEPVPGGCSLAHASVPYSYWST